MEKRQISHDDIIALLKAIDDLPKTNAQLPTKFYYALTKNRRPLHNAAKEIEDVMTRVFKDFADEENDAKEMRVPKYLVTDYNDEVKDFLRDMAEFEFYQFPYKELEKEIPKLQGVGGIFLIMEFIIRDDSDEAKIKVPEAKINYEPKRKQTDKTDPRAGAGPKAESKVGAVDEEKKHDDTMSFKEEEEKVEV